VQFHSDRRPLQERVSAVLSSMCHRTDASRNITTQTEARNDHTQRPHATATRNGHTQRPHATAARNGRTKRPHQRPHASTTRNNCTRQPHATTPRNNRTQQPHATTTRNNHTHRPHTTTARHDCTQSPRIPAYGAHPGRAHTMANCRPPPDASPDPSHKSAGAKAARICWAIRRRTATACRGEVGCTSEPSHASRPRERSERVGQEAPCLLHELSVDDPYDRRVHRSRNRKTPNLSGLAGSRGGLHSAS
jgi:hypothetical protein